MTAILCIFPLLAARLTLLARTLRRNLIYSVLPLAKPDHMNKLKNAVILIFVSSMIVGCLSGEGDGKPENTASIHDSSGDLSGQNQTSITTEKIRLTRNEEKTEFSEWQLVCERVSTIEISDEPLQEDERRLRIEVSGKILTLNPTPLAKTLNFSPSAVANGVFFLPGKNNPLDAVLTPEQTCRRLLFNPVVPGHDCQEIAVSVLQRDRRVVVQVSSKDISVSYGPVSLRSSEQHTVDAEDRVESGSDSGHELDIAKVDSTSLDSLFPNDTGSWRTNTSLHRPPFDQVIEFICNVEMDGDGLCGFPNNPNADLPFSTTTLRLGVDRRGSRVALVPLEYLTDDVCTSTAIPEAELREEYYLTLP